MTSKQLKSVLDAYFVTLKMASERKGVCPDAEDYEIISELFDEYKCTKSSEEKDGTQ